MPKYVVKVKSLYVLKGVQNKLEVRCSIFEGLYLCSSWTLDLVRA